jgi:hypothetical protein
LAVAVAALAPVLAAALAPLAPAARFVAAVPALALVAVLLAPDLACVAVRPAARRVLVAVALAPLLAAVVVRFAALVRFAPAAGLELEDERFAAGMWTPYVIRDAASLSKIDTNDTLGIGAAASSSSGFIGN